MERFVHYMYICMCVAYTGQCTFSFSTMQESSHCFWPEGSDSAGVDGVEEVYGKLTVTLKRLRGYGDITERRLKVAESEGTSPHRIVTLLQLSSWPLEEVPHPSAILSLVDLLSKAQRTSPSRHIIVMCRYSILSLSKSIYGQCVILAVMEWVVLGHSSVCTLSWRD